MPSTDPLNVERRQHPRIRKNYLLRFFSKAEPSRKFEFSQVEDISRGGIRFSSTQPFPEGVDLTVEVRAPFITEAVFFEGRVLQSHERAKGLIYSNRLKFNDLTPKSREVLDKIEMYNAREKHWR